MSAARRAACAHCRAATAVTAALRRILDGPHACHTDVTNPAHKAASYKG